ncbi:MAG TPA: SpoIIE family protein phosphatase [Blastocatellia bacterium]|nr:SpoIIE family protein phosphatase [Blastocatellia bacterium]
MMNVATSEEARRWRALIADDQPDVLEALRLLLKGEGFQTDAVMSPAEVIEALQAHNYDLLLMDLNYARDTTSGQEGLDLLNAVRALDDTLPIVVMTAWGSIELTVEAMRRGVRDFVLKPWENARLVNTLRAQVEAGRALRHKEHLKTERRLIAQIVLEATDQRTMLELIAGRISHALERATAIFTRAPRDHGFMRAAAAGDANGLEHLAGMANREWHFDGSHPLNLAGVAFDEALAAYSSTEPPALIVPVKVNNEIVGLLGVVGKHANDGFDADDMKFLDAAAEQIASGISNFHLKSQERELAEARLIQERLLPKAIPQIEGCEIAAAWRPARTVSGDYFDVLKFDERCAAVCIADVSGKGMPAALLMSNVQAAVKAFATGDLAPAAICEKLNRVVGGNIADDRFITFFYGLLDTARKTFTYANAGHCQPMLVRAAGDVLRLDKGGLMLGPFPGLPFEQGKIQLQAGDRLLLFTDGITEADNGCNEEFDEARLTDILINNRAFAAARLEEVVMEKVMEFCKGDFHDDATLLVLSFD